MNMILGGGALLLTLQASELDFVLRTVGQASLRMSRVVRKQGVRRLFSERLKVVT